MFGVWSDFKRERAPYADGLERSGEKIRARAIGVRSQSTYCVLASLDTLQHFVRVQTPHLDGAIGGGAVKAAVDDLECVHNAFVPREGLNDDLLVAVPSFNGEVGGPRENHVPFKSQCPDRSCVPHIRAHTFELVVLEVDVLFCQ